MMSKLSSAWITRMCAHFGKVSRRQIGNLGLSEEKQLERERAIAHHLGTMKRGFSSVELEDWCVENMDETHLRINMDNGRTIAEIGDRNVKYLDVLSGGQGMTMMVRLSGGAGEIIANPFIVFQNESRSYAIRKVPDNVPCVSYRSQQKGWVDQKVMLEYISDSSTLPKDRDDKRRTLYFDNCSGTNSRRRTGRRLQRQTLNCGFSRRTARILFNMQIRS
jgi:hypothetical protein